MRSLLPLMVGFDHLNSTLNTIFEDKETYPSFNIVKQSDSFYRIELALAGFKEEEVDVIQDNRTLEVSGQKAASTDKVEYLHQGIAFRKFKRTFALAENTNVKNVELKDGLLIITLETVIPEHQKPKRFTIGRFKALDTEKQTAG